MLRLPSPFLSASSNVCFSHFGAELGFSASSRVAEPPPPAGRSRRDGPRASALPPLPQRVARQGQGSPAQSGPWRAHRWAPPWALPPRPRILVPGALAAGQAVLVTDAGHEVAQPRDPGASFVPAARNQVQRLAGAAVVDAEAAVGVEAAVGIALEDL